MTDPRVSRFDLQLWARMARQAEQAARTEDAPVAFGIISALASYLDDAEAREALTHAVAETAEEFRRQTADQIWDSDYRATHRDDDEGLEESLRRVFGR